MTSFILRKRAIEFSDDDDDNSQAWPPTPSKRRSGTAAAFFSQFNDRPVSAPNFQEIARRLAEGGSEENDDDSASQKQDRLRAIRATFLSSLPTPSSSSVSSPTSSPPAGLPTSHETMTSITPPRTPTRRSTRQLHLQEPSTALTSVKGTRRSESKKTENNRGGEENDDSENTAPEDISPVGLTPSKKKTQSVPVTPPKAMMRSTSSSNLGNNSLTTGLTPAMNRMLKPSKAILEENAKSRRARAATVTTASSSSNPFLNSADQEDSENIDVNRIQGYSTPKRLQRTKSMVNENRGPMNNNAAGPATLKRHMTDASLAASSSSSASSSANSAPASKMLGYYQEAKTLFRRTTEPNRLVGRAAERETIRKFCEEHVLTTKSGSLYISGQPGTGKTALLKEVMRDMEPEMETLDHEVKTVTINCMAIQDPKLVYVKLLEEMRLSADSKSKEGAVKMLEKLFLGTGKNKTMFVVILDEIDQLLTKDQEVLYKLFQWSSAEESRLTLVGIANALDMTDRFLPRLKARSCEPQLLNFNPYQVAEIRAIILDRLFSLEDTLSDNRSAGQNDAKKSDDQTKARVVPLMQKPAIELCARKVAAATGDLRKALDICRQTIEMVEMEAKKKERLERLQQQRRPNPTPLAEIRLGDLENRIAGGSLDRNTHARTLSNPSVAATGTAGQDGAGTGVGMTLQDAPKVTVEHVKRALASAFGSPMVLKIRSLNVHQKIVLLLLVDRIRVGKAGTDSQMGKIFDLYTSKCRASNKFGAVSRGEFQDLVSMLEVTGLVTLGKAKEERLRKIDLVPRDIEVLEAIKEQDILGAFVQPQLSAVSE